MKKMIYLAGLPRSGSTLLCNILNYNKQLRTTPSSPLCNIVQGIKKQWSSEPFLLSQLDNNFDNINLKLKTSLCAFMHFWHHDIQEEFVIDKNRDWLSSIELLRYLDPELKIILTIRDLRNIYASIEKVHKKTILLDFPDNLENAKIRKNQLIEIQKWVEKESEENIHFAIYNDIWSLGSEDKVENKIQKSAKKDWAWKYLNFVSLEFFRDGTYKDIETRN